MNEKEHNLWMDFHERNKNPLWRLDKSHHGVTNADLVDAKNEDVGNVIEVIPNKWHLEGTVYTHTSMVYHEAIKSSRTLTKESDKAELLFSALAHDIGKPFMRQKRTDEKTDTTKISFVGHDYCSAIMSIKWAKKYFDDKTVLKVAKALALHTTMFKVDDVTPFIDDDDLYTLLRDLSDADNKGRFSLDESERNPIYDNTDVETTDFDVDKPWMTIMIGIPGCGKSTVARDYGKVFSTDDNMERIAREDHGITDDYNEAFKVVSESKVNWVEDTILSMEKHTRTCVEDIVLDATNLSKKRRKGVANRFRKTHNIRFVMVWRDFEDCRNSRHIDSGKYISDAVYKRMFFSFSYPSSDECDTIEHIIIPDNLDT